MRTVERLVLWALAGAALAGCAGARYEPPRNRYNTIDTGGQIFGPKEKWKEAEVTIPPYPESADLLPFEISGPTDNAYYVDSRSISIGGDGVVRYTLLARSQAGVENVTYEGIHCETRKWKAYAFGRRDRTWASSRDPGWQQIDQQKIDNFRFSLYQDYFCPDGHPQRKKEQAIAEIRRQYRAGPLDDRRYPASSLKKY